MISIILVQHNHAELTRQAVESIQTIERSAYEIILIDNASTDSSTIEYCQSIRNTITVITNNSNVGFGQANNQGAHIAKGEILFFLNNDTIFTEPVFDTVQKHFQEFPKCGIVGVSLKNSDNTFQISTGIFPSIVGELRTIRQSKSKKIPTNIEWVSGAALAIRKELFQVVGGFDENYFMYFEDADLCKRVMQLGFSIDYEQNCSIIHLGGRSWKWNVVSPIVYEYRRSQILFYKKHNSLAQNIFLRTYLLIKFFRSALRGKTDSYIARKIITILFHAHRH